MVTHSGSDYDSCRPFLGEQSFLCCYLFCSSSGRCHRSRDLWRSLAVLWMRYINSLRGACEEGAVVGVSWFTGQVSSVWVSMERVAGGEGSFLGLTTSSWYAKVQPVWPNFWQLKQRSGLGIIIFPLGRTSNQFWYVLEQKQYGRWLQMCLYFVYCQNRLWLVCWRSHWRPVSWAPPEFLPWSNQWGLDVLLHLFRCSVCGVIWLWQDSQPDCLICLVSGFLWQSQLSRADPHCEGI